MESWDFQGREVRMTIELTFEKVLKASDDLVKANPKKVYKNHFGDDSIVGESCYYVHAFDENDNPVDPQELPESHDPSKNVVGCHVGAVLAKLGVPLSELLKVEGSPAHVALGDLMDAGVVSVRFGEVGQIKTYLQSFQSQQDSGEEWGKSQNWALELMGIEPREEKDADES
jgi:hypothetical protein